MTKNQRILSYDSSYQYASSAMVRTDDNFHYSIQVGGDDNRATSEGTDNDGGGQMPTWSVVLLFVSIGLIFLGWCTYAAYSAYFPSESPQVAQDQQADSEIKLSRKQRKALLLQYFERTGTQMEVKEGDILRSMNSTYGDIEEGTNQGNEKELGESRQILEATEAAMEEGEEHTSFVLLVNKSISRIISPQALPTENGEEKSSEMDLQNPSAMNAATLPTSEAKDDMEDCDASSASCIQITDNNDQPHLPVHMQQQYVSDCCAICLDPYQVGDMIVWSSTATCPHVFHKHCFVDYLLSYRGKGAPCPSCRQSYVDECIFSISCKEQQKRNSEASSLTSTVDEEAPVVDLSAPGSSVQPIIAVEAT